MAKRGLPRVIGSLVLGFVECVFFGAPINGWPNLVFVFKQEGLFSHLCENQTSLEHQNGSVSDSVPICGEADRMFSLCFSVSSALFLASAFPIGLLFDRYGFWMTRISATVFFVPGILMLAFSQEANSILIFPGLIMLSIGGTHIIVTAPHLALQAGNKKSMVATLYSGGIDLGVVVFLAVKLLYENHGITHQASLSFVCGLWVVVLVNTFVCCPRFKLSLEDMVGKNEAKIDTISIKAGEKAESNEPVSKDGLAIAPEPEATFAKCLRTPYFWLMAVWFCLMQLRFLFFVGSMNTWLSVKTENDIDRVSVYINAYSYISFGGLLFSPLAGFLTDQFVKRGSASDCKVPFLPMAKAMSPCLWIGTIMAIAHSVAALFFGDVMVYVIFVLFIIWRAFLFGNVVVYVSRVFPTAEYGKCLGLLYLLSAAISCIQYAFFTWAESSQNFELVNGVLLVLIVLSLSLPIYIEVKYKINTLSTEKKIHPVFTVSINGNNMRNKDAQQSY